MKQPLTPIDAPPTRFKLGVVYPAFASEGAVKTIGAVKCTMLLNPPNAIGAFRCVVSGQEFKRVRIRHSEAGHEEATLHSTAGELIILACKTEEE